jgi:cytochrome c553
VGQFFSRASDLNSRSQNSVELTGERLQSATSLFAARCASCHSADGNSSEARTNLVDQIWFHGGSLAEIESTIRDGVPGTPMAAQKGRLTEDQIADLARYVKSLERGMHARTSEPARSAATNLTGRVAREIPPGARTEFAEDGNLIDNYIFGKMKADKVPHSGLCSDAEFMRRVYLDLWGRLPDVEPGTSRIIDQIIDVPTITVQQFVADRDPDKRNKLVDHLLGLDYNRLPVATGPDYKGPWLVQRPFVGKWTAFFTDLFRADSERLFQSYIYHFIKYDVPYDYVVRDMLTTSSLAHDLDAAAGFLLRNEVDGLRCADVMHEDTCDEMALHATRLFTGVSMECIGCHDGAYHLEKINLWLSKKKRVDFWRQAAFFGNLRVFRPGLADNNYTLIDGAPLRPEAIWQGKIAYFNFTSPPGALGGPGYRMEAPSVLRTARDKNAKVHPAFLLTSECPKPGVNPRAEFARMVTSHPQFAKATVNLIWSKLMTVGIVDPPFAWDLDRQDPKHPPPAPWTIQPSHPELLEALAEDFKEHNYDLRYVMRTICQSKAYQLSSRFDGEYKPEWDRYYARKLVRHLSAEELYDAVSKATNVFGHGVTCIMDTYGVGDQGKPDAKLRAFLDLQKGDKGSIVQASLMLNSDIIKEKIMPSPEGSRVRTLLNKTPLVANKQIAEELFLATLSRYPTKKELAVAVKHLEDYRDKGAEDLQWALINKLEFQVNY